VLETGEVPAFGYCGYCHRDLDATPRVEGVDHRLEPPGLPLVCEGLLEARKPCGVLGYGTDVFLKDDLLGGRGTNDLAEPPQGSGAPGGPACIPDSLPQEKRFEPKRRGLEVVDGLFPRPAQIANRFSVHFGYVNRGEIPRAPQAGQFDGVSSIGCHPILWFLGEQRGRDDPADLAFCCPIAGEPIATRAGVSDKDEGGPFGWELTDEFITGPLTGANIPHRDDLRMVFFSDIGNGEGLFVDIQSDIDRGRLGHG
jgi:hypothetical protein